MSCTGSHDGIDPHGPGYNWPPGPESRAKIYYWEPQGHSLSIYRWKQASSRRVRRLRIASEMGEDGR